jgi:membrane-bound metal-dependent hydrolase YbcI (DUF457 family)
MNLSTLGIVHTVVSILAIVCAIAGFATQGRVVPGSRLGRAYIVGTAIACLTAFGLARTGHFGPGHVLAALALICLVVAIVAELKKFKHWLLIQTFALTTSVFLSMIPATIETLTRLPLGAPFATGPEDPVAQRWLAVLLVGFLAGLGYQTLKLRRRRR